MHLRSLILCSVDCALRTILDSQNAIFLLFLFDQNVTFRVSVSLLILILLSAFSIRFLGADSREQTRRPLGAHQSIWQ